MNDEVSERKKELPEKADSQITRDMLDELYWDPAVSIANLTVSTNHHRVTLTGTKEPSDGVLVEQAVAGDERAFEALVSRYQHVLLNSIRRILKDDELAYDVLQFVLLKFYVALPTLRRDVRVKAWLLQVAHNRCMDELRRQRCRPMLRFSELSRDDEYDELEPTACMQDPHPLPQEILEQLDLQAILQQAIGKLPPRFRQVVDLRFFEQLSFAEIGQTLKMPTSTAKTYCYRSLRRLRSALANSPSLALVS
jgi:RNA polymerase sigma factor (sigma-70 family)